MKICKKCGKQIMNKYNLFCNRSCSASFNNKNRKHTIESRLKCSQKLVEHYINNPDKAKKRYYQNILNGHKMGNRKVTEKNRVCTYCKNQFLARRKENNSWPRLCSDKCYLLTKQKNARGNKSLFYKGMRFDSSWEIEIAKHLDIKNIIWVHAPCIYWVDNNQKKRRYFPDFYLPKYNVYLDPKNPICIGQQKEKISIVEKTINLIYGNKEKIIDYINKLVDIPEFESGTLVP